MRCPLLGYKFTLLGIFQWGKYSRSVSLKENSVMFIFDNLVLERCHLSLYFKFTVHVLAVYILAPDTIMIPTFSEQSKLCLSWCSYKSVNKNCWNGIYCCKRSDSLSKMSLIIDICNQVASLILITWSHWKQDDTGSYVPMHFVNYCLWAKCYSPQSINSMGWILCWCKWVQYL